MVRYRSHQPWLEITTPNRWPIPRESKKRGQGGNVHGIPRTLTMPPPTGHEKHSNFCPAPPFSGASISSRGGGCRQKHSAARASTNPSPGGATYLPSADQQRWVERLV